MAPTWAVPGLLQICSNLMYGEESCVKNKTSLELTRRILKIAAMQPAVVRKIRRAAYFSSRITVLIIPKLLKKCT